MEKTEDWEYELFGHQDIELLTVTVDFALGELVAIARGVAEQDDRELEHLAGESLRKFFEHYGIEMRDVVPNGRFKREEPLPDLVQITANLVPIDTLSTLEDALTEELITRLRKASYAHYTTLASAVVKPIYHNGHKGVIVNWGVELRAVEGHPPLSERMYRSGPLGSPENPVKQDEEGTFFFVLSNPFDAWTPADEQTGATAVQDCEIAAGFLGAILVKMTRIDKIQTPTI
ncbi:MAG: hypothetical protein ACQR33_03515 [Candidatus Saccharibacteria bacterium]